MRLAEKFKNNYLWLLGVWLVGLLPFVPFLFSGKILFASDQIPAVAYPIFFEQLKRGIYPLWQEYVMAGMPMVDAMAGDRINPLFLLCGLILPVKRLVGLVFVLHVLIAGATAFLLVRKFFKLERLWCFLLAVAYMLNTNYITHIHAGHTGKFAILSWLPMGLYFLFSSLSRNARWHHLLGLCLSISLFLYTSHIQYTYYVLMGFFLFWCFRISGFLRSRQFGRVGALTVKFWLPIFLGIGLSFPVFYPPYQYNKKFSVRGTSEKQTYEHATSWSSHPEEIASLVVPEFNGVLGKYWGRNPFKLNSEYSGALLLFLGILGLVYVKSSVVRFWGVIAGLAIFFALGANTPVFHLFFNLVPGMKNFRAPSMMLFWYVMALWLISAYTVQWLTQNPPTPKPNPQKFAKVAAGIIGVLVLAGLFPGSTYSIWSSIFSKEAITNFSKLPENYNDFRLGAIKSGVLFSLLTIFVWGCFTRKTISKNWIYGLIALTLVDLFWINSHFIKTYSLKDYFPEDKVLNYLKNDTGKFRVMEMPGAYTRGHLHSLGISQVTGFADNELKIFREFRGGNYQTNPNFLHGLRQHEDGSVSGSHFLDLLNVKYLVFRYPDRSPGLALNKTWLPRVFFVGHWIFEEDSLTIEKLKGSDFRPRETAYVSQVHKPDLPAAPASPGRVSAEIELLEKNANKRIYMVKNKEAGIFIRSATYFPFWQVSVDGKPVVLLRTDFALQGVFLKPGEHRVVFQYRSPWIRTGFMICGLSLALLAAFLFLYNRQTRKRLNSARNEDKA